jgi:hypothetical protein
MHADPAPDSPQTIPPAAHRAAVSIAAINEKKLIANPSRKARRETKKWIAGFSWLAML